MPTDIRVVIADDHPVFRHGLQQVVERQADMQVVEAVADGAATLDVIRRLSPDVAVLVPAHRSPARDSHSDKNRPSVMPVWLGLNVVKRMPSKRARPLSVASQR